MAQDKLKEEGWAIPLHQPTKKEHLAACSSKRKIISVYLEIKTLLCNFCGTKQDANVHFANLAALTLAAVNLTHSSKTVGK